MALTRRSLFTLAAATVATGPGCGMMTTVRDGKVDGTVSQLARHGWLIPTWEGEIALSNLRNRSATGGGSSKFHFHVDNAAVQTKI